MFKQYLIILLIGLVFTYFIVRYILIKNHTLFLNENIIKYPMSNSDLEYLKKNSTPLKLSQIQKGDIFISKSKWSTKNNNYIKFKDRYYIIDINHYYHLNEDCELFLNKNTIVLKKNKSP